MLALTFLLIFSVVGSAYENVINFRVEAGTKTCFFENGKAGQLMEVQYQVIDGQHGDLDISFEVTDPKRIKLVSDYKQSYNAFILDLETDGEYEFCLDNTYSIMNSKLVFIYVLIEDKNEDNEYVNVVSDDEQEEAVLEWEGIAEDGEKYYIEVSDISHSLTRTLKHVVKARHLLDVYSATKSRDSYLAVEDTFIVDVWSAFQISFMFLVGMLQVYMIKQLFNRPSCNNVRAFC